MAGLSASAFPSIMRPPAVGNRVARARRLSRLLAFAFNHDEVAQAHAIRDHACDVRRQRGVTDESTRNPACVRARAAGPATGALPATASTVTRQPAAGADSRTGPSPGLRGPRLVRTAVRGRCNPRRIRNRWSSFMLHFLRGGPWRVAGLLPCRPPYRNVRPVPGLEQVPFIPLERDVRPARIRHLRREVVSGFRYKETHPEHGSEP